MAAKTSTMQSVKLEDIELLAVVTFIACAQMGENMFLM